MTQASNPPMSPPPPPPRPRRGSFLGRVFTGLVTTVLVVSLLANFYLGMFFVSMTSGASELTYEKGDDDHRIAIVPVQGVIASDMANFIRTALKHLREADPRPDAVVLRVVSPGGTISGSDEIWHELTKFKDETKIPIVASFGSLAASGGYYISAPSDYIVAEPTTITGSIGVIAQAFTIEELLQKVGVKPEVITATEATKKDMLDFTRAWTDADRTALRGLLDHGYERFVSIVQQGRPQQFKTVDDVKKLATGEVFTADKAKELKLIDSIGYLEDAIDKAGQLAKLPAGVKPTVTIIRQPASLFSLLGVSAPAQSQPRSFTPDDVRDMLSELGTPRLEYRWQLGQ